MFSEELKSNPALKRQAEARNRRRLLLKEKKENEKKKKQEAEKLKKKEQEKNEKENVNEKNQKLSLISQIDNSLKSETDNTTLNTVTIDSQSIPENIVNNFSKDSTDTRQNAPKKDYYSTKFRNTSKSSNQNTGGASAIEIAAEQRQIRSQLKLQNNSALKIQALYRCHQSNKKIFYQHRKSFDKKISDIKTLISILKSQSQKKTSNASSLAIDYVPPPATSTELTREFLFIAKFSDCVKQQKQHSTKRQPISSLTREDQLRLESLIRYVLLPGLKTKDEEMQVINVWIESFVGKQRFMTVLKLCLDHLAYANIDDDNCHKQESFIIYQYLFTLFVDHNKYKKNQDITRYIENLFYTENNKVDLISMLRNLLCGVHISEETSTSMRLSPLVENKESIKKCDKQRMNSFFTLVLQVILKDGKTNFHLYNRFVKEIFTVPLLTWKVDTSVLMKNVDTLQSPSPFLLFIEHFFQEIHDEVLLTNEPKHLNTILPPVALNFCPAPSILCLLANLVQLGKSCDHINALNSSQFDFEAASVYFNILTILFDQCPLGTFTQRAAVEWININSTFTAIPLSPIIIDQCRLILLDSWIRTLFHKAIDPDILGTEKIMKQKNNLDLKYEKEMMAGENAMALAAKEATHERGEGFVWQSSKWAKKLSKTMNNIFAGNTKKQVSTKSKNGQGTLVNTSSISKELAHGNHNKIQLKDVLTSDAKGKNTLNNKMQKRYTTSFLYSICRAYATILSRWGGSGDYDIVNQRSLSNDNIKSSQATTKREPSAVGILNVLCFSTSIIETTWGILQANDAMKNGLKSFSDPDSSESFLRDLHIYSTFKTSKQSEDSRIGSVIIFLFLSSLSHTLLITDDIEIHNDKPLPRHHLRRCILLLKQILYRACFIDIETAKVTTKSKKSYFGLSLLSIASKTMRDLYDRSSRRPLCVPKRWLVDDLLSKELAKAKTFEDYVLMLQLPILSICPYFVPFQRRLVLFNNIVTASRCQIQGSNATHDLRPGVMVSISRSRVLEDGLLYLNSLGKNALRQRLVVTYLNEAGTRETGVDAGGLLKEFWCDLCALAFDPNYALFQTAQIESGSFLYPNPASSTAHGSDHITLFGFLGRILGKALYEGITIQPQFSHFFLSFMRGDYNYMHMLSDLSTMDPVLYSNLMFLKTYSGDASDLSLSFTVANDDFGNNKEIELIPNGTNIDVTNYNKERYISLVAKYHVCDRLRTQAEAFTRGLWDVIDPAWLQLFNEPELQVLISGSNTGKIDVADMRAHSRYVGGYTGLDRNIHRFWKVVSNMTPSQQAALLKFVTSCERPPASGFKSMNPPFTIQRVWITKDKDKLPTASTCFNTLKLPTYSSEKVLRQRLLYSIEAGAGFELT